MDRLNRVRVMLLAVMLAGCGSGGRDSFSAPGIDTGSASSNFTEASNGVLPSLGAALGEPVQDDFDAIRFLHRATFGPRLQDIDDLKQLGYLTWLERQIGITPTFLLPPTRSRTEPRWAEHVNSWFKVTVNAPDQLRQRVAFALSQLFVVSDREGLFEQPAALANYYDILIANSFGNFRDLLEQVTLSPVMGDYLSMKGNQKSDPENNIRPDENYARELLQLFSIGVVQLRNDGSVIIGDNNQPLATYDQSVVEGFAKVFTGWHFNDVDNWNYPENADWFSPMRAYDDYHDRGEKTLLNNHRVAAGQSAETDMQTALDNVFNHPNVAPFVSRHLITQLVTSNPSPAYIARISDVFNGNDSGQRGNLAAVITAILLDDEALNGYAESPGTFGKLREPLVRLVALWRAFDGNPDHPDFEYGWIEERLAQAPLQSPTVFNFFSPQFSQPGAIRDANLKSPEFQIHHEGSIIAITSALLGHSLWQNTHNDGFDPALAPIKLDALTALDENPEAQMQLLARLTLGQPASAGLLAQGRYLLEQRTYTDPGIRAAELVFLFSSSPEAAIQR